MEEMTTLVCEEVQRLLETCFSYHNPYTCEISAEGVPFEERDNFYRMVEEELLERGKKITRDRKYGQYFKINEFQKR